MQASHDAHGGVLDSLEDGLTSHEIKSAALLVSPNLCCCSCMTVNQGKLLFTYDQHVSVVRHIPCSWQLSLVEGSARFTYLMSYIHSLLLCQHQSKQRVLCSLCL